jgi:uncharacterized LabA/DUF88 family protein
MTTYVSIDAANIIYRPTDQDFWKIDLKKLYAYLCNRFEGDRIFYYAGVESKNKKQLVFYHKLAEWGYELRLNPVKYFYNNEGRKYKKADGDSRMTFDIMQFFPEYSSAVLLTGDGDYYWVIQNLLTTKDKIWLLSSPSKTAKELKKIVAGDFANLDNLRLQLELKETDSTNDSVSGIT